MAVARIVVPVAGLVLGAAAVAGVLVGLDRLAAGERDAERRALLARDAALSSAELAPGSPLACLDAGAGDAVENACEKAVFASAQSTAGAVAYMDARLKLLAEAKRLADHGDGSVMTELSASRRAAELDRFGVAAHVLETRDGCTANKCAAFGLVVDASALKANLRGQVFDQYVSRYSGQWNEAPPQPKAPAVSQAPGAVAPVASIAPSSGGPMPAPIKPGEKWDFPSAASIPAVSIMGKEPPPPKGAEASAQAAPGEKPATNGNAPPAAPAVPLPPAAPKHTAPQAAPAPAR